MDNMRVYLVFTSFETGSHSNQVVIGEKMLRKYVMEHFHNVMRNQYNEDDYTEVVKDAKKEVEQFIKECSSIKAVAEDNYNEFVDESWITITYMGDNPMKVFTDAVIESKKLERKKQKRCNKKK